MILVKTKYYGIHTDRVRALAEQLGRGKNLEEKKISDELFGKSRESIRSLKTDVRDKTKQTLHSPNFSEFFTRAERINKANDRLADRLSNHSDDANKEFYHEINKKIGLDYSLDSLKRIFTERRSPLNYLRDRKIQKEMEKDVLDKGLTKEIHKDFWKELPSGRKKLNRGSSSAVLNTDEVHLSVFDRHRPDVLGHEVDHLVHKHESKAGDALASNTKPTDIVKNTERILNEVNRVQNEHNTADRGKVMRPYLSSKSVTDKDLRRYFKNKTNYNLALQGYIPPSLDYHTDPKTIQKIKDQVAEQEAIKDYLNTDRKWI
jgi:hypothetical protein